MGGGRGGWREWRAGSSTMYNVMYNVSAKLREDPSNQPRNTGTAQLSEHGPVVGSVW